MIKLKKRKKYISLMITFLIIITYINNTPVEAATEGWKNSGGGWWYQFSDGSYAYNEYINGYWIDSAGWYDSAWNGCWDQDDIGWWYKSGSWYPKDTWLKIDGVWYYFKSDGYMACNEWIGNYYLTDTGAMATNTWIGQYYVGADGAWIPNYTDKTTEQKTTEQKTTEQKSTETQPAEKVTTYTVFDPHFYCEFQCVPVDGYTGEGAGRSSISTHGWTNYNYVVCDTCKTKYNSYSEYRQKDTCNIVTFTNNDKKYISKSLADRYNNGVKEMSAYNYYFDFCPKYMGCVEYQYKAYVQCNKCMGLFETGLEFSAHCNEKHNGFEHSSFIETATSTNQIYEKAHYPELISTETK